MVFCVSPPEDGELPIGWFFPSSTASEASPASWVLLDAEASPQRLLLGWC